MSENNFENEYLKLKNDFSSYYETELKPLLEQYESTRRRYLMYFTILFLMAVLLYPYLINEVIKNFGHSNNMVGLILGISAVAVMFLAGPFYFYKKKVKPQILPTFANFFGNFTYGFEGCLDNSVLQTSQLFAEYNRNIGDDYFQGAYDDVGITIAEEKLQFVKRDFRNHEMKKKVFQGVCILLQMNKNFKGRTVVLKDKGLLNTFNRLSGMQNVKLEDSVFEKYFEVYADDQIEARYLLTTGFMERMLKLRDLYNGKSIQFSFYNNMLLLAIPTGKNMFEATSFFRSNINKAKIDMVFEQFCTIFSVIKLLKLNQRIGM